MSKPQSNGEVLLAEDHSALTVLHALLADAAAAFPEALGAVGLPADPRAFRSVYPETLPLFEAARLASAQRHEIARHVMAAQQRYVVWQDSSGKRPLHEALRESAAPLPLQTHTFDGDPGWHAHSRDLARTAVGVRARQLEADLELRW